VAQIPLEVIISGTDKFSGTANKVVGSLRAIEGSAGRVGRGVGQVATGLTRLGLVAAGAAAGGLAAIAKQAISWESALAGVNKTMDLTPDELKTIGTEIRKLATTIPLSANAIAGLVEQAGALGIAKDDVVAFAEAAATLGVTTDVSADTAAASLGVMSNLLGITGQDYERFASTLVDLGNKGASTESAILAIAERAAGAGATIGLSADEVLGFASAVANIGIEAEAGGSSLQRVFLDVAKAVAAGAGDVKLFAKTSGMSVAKFSDLFERDAAGALESFIDGLSRLGSTERLQVLDALGLDDVRVGRMLLGLAEAEGKTDNLSKSLNVSASAWASNTAAAEEADKRYATVASKLGLLKNQAIESALLIGEGFLPSLGRMADRLKTFLSDTDSRAALVAFGKDIGAAFDAIDFDALLQSVKDIAATFRDFVLPVLRTGLDLFRSLPGPIQGLGAALAIGANTPIVGGALSSVGRGLGNIGMGVIGGIGAAAGKGLGGAAGGLVSRAFAQPVFVTNWPMGGLGGGVGGAAGAAGAGGIGGALATGAKLVVPLVVAQAVGDEIRKAVGIDGNLVLNSLQRQQAGVGAEPASSGISSRNTLLAIQNQNASASSRNVVVAQQRQTDAIDRVYDAVERNRLAIASMPPPIVNVNVNVTGRAVTTAQTQIRRAGSTTRLQAE